MLSVSGLSTLTKVLQHILVQDPETMASLSTLEGKCIGIAFYNTEIEFYLLPGEHGIQIHRTAHKVDVWIRATPMSWLIILCTRDLTQSATDLEITGDVGVAQKLHHILQQMDIDMADYLSPYIGDIMAHQLGRLFKRSRIQLQQIMQSVVLDLSDYLRFERQLLPDSNLVEDFLQQVDELNFATERLEKRMDKLTTGLKVTS